MSNNEAEDFFEFVSNLPPVRVRREAAREQRESRRRVSADVDAALREQFPWLPNRLTNQFRSAASSKRYALAEQDDHGESSSASDSDAEPEIRLDEEELEQELEALRAEFEGVNTTDAFYLRPLCGKWTKLQKGVASDAIAGFARQPDGREWVSSMCFAGTFC